MKGSFVMDIVIVRALHIFGGIIWVGFGLMAGMLGMAAQKMDGRERGIVFKALFVYSAYSRVIAIAAVTTTVAGLYLYGRLFDGMRHQFMTPTASMVLAFGALFGLLAFGHGIALGRLGGKYAELAKNADANPEELQALGERIGRNGRISAILMIIAVIGMILPRYMQLIQL
jgi:uncharacterized membrane protein